jgi:hypothetical protein
MYTDLALHFSFRYPSNWKAESANRTSGADGFFEVDLLPGSISEFVAGTSRCVLEANKTPNAFGNFPVVSSWNGFNTFGCTITPDRGEAPTPEEQAVLYAPMARPWPKDTTLALRTDVAHFDAILSTFQVNEFATITPHPINVYDTPAGSEPLPDPSPHISHFAGLTITEYPLVNAGCEPEAHIEGFQARVQALSFNVFDLWNSDLSQTVEEDNQALEPFGYRLVPRYVTQPTGSGSKQVAASDLYHEDELLAFGLQRIGQVSVNADGTDFILWVQDTYDNLPATEIRRESFKTFSYWETSFNTSWVGSDVIEYQYDRTDHLYGAGAPTRANLYRNGQLIFTLVVPTEWAAGEPIDSLISWNGHWILEMDNIVFEDGQILNQALGYSEIFNLHLVNNKPFYFYRKGNSYAISYGGQTLPWQYDDILHGDLCCSYGVYNIDSLSTGAWFYARKGDIWYLVSALSE